MTIEKLASGSYRITQMRDGKRYRVTVDHKPTKREANELMAEAMDETNHVNVKGTFADAARGYIAARENVLSPKTIREYSMEINRLPKWFTETNMSDITKQTIQAVVNEIALKVSPKTTRNRYGFISAVIGFYNPMMKISARLPQKQKNEPVIPLDEDVKKLLAYVKEKEPLYYVPIVLGCYGLRRSEICALTLEDIDGNVVRINKALVENKNNEWVIKYTKTTMSTRTVIIPMEIVQLINAQGYIYNGSPGQISECMDRVQRILGLPQFSLHKLRHYFASKMLEITDQKTVQELGGWSGNETVSKIYQHSLTIKNEQKMRDLSKKFGDSFL